MARTNNYNSFPMYFTAILFQNLIIGEVARLTDAVNDWTEWELCNKSLRPNCHRFRELTCEKQGFENLGVECATGSRDNLLEVFEQQLSTGCNPINTDDITTLCLQNLLNEMPCQGHCYDAVQKVQYNCTEARGQCILSGYRRCYNPDNCLGTWSDWIPEENCSASCGGGTRSETRSCYEKSKQTRFFTHFAALNLQTSNVEAGSFAELPLPAPVEVLLMRVYFRFLTLRIFRFCFWLLIELIASESASSSFFPSVSTSTFAKIYISVIVFI